MTKEELSKEYAKGQYPYTEEMRFQCEQHYEAGWDSALKHQWTIPSSRETIPNPKIVLEKGMIALLSNGRVQYQKDMRGFYWEEKDEKFVYNYSDVVAWMYAPSVDEVVGRKE